MALDHAFLRTPQDFSSMLIEMQEGSWPPDEADIIRIAQGCSMLIECIDAWESVTHGKNVFDVARGEICTADVRRLLAQEVSLSYEGDVAVLLVPPADERVRVEIRADVDEYQGLLRRPEMVLDWEQDGWQAARALHLTQAQRRALVHAVAAARRHEGRPAHRPVLDPPQPRQSSSDSQPTGAPIDYMVRACKTGSPDGRFATPTRRGAQHSPSYTGAWRRSPRPQIPRCACRVQFRQRRDDEIESRVDWKRVTALHLQQSWPWLPTLRVEPQTAFR